MTEDKILGISEGWSVAAFVSTTSAAIISFTAVQLVWIIRISATVLSLHVITLLC